MKTRNTSRAFALPTVLIISIIMLSVLVSAVSSTSSTRVALMNQHYDELSRQAADAGVVYAKACIAADSGKTPRWSDAKPLMPNTDCNGDVTHVCPETSTDPECSVLVTDNNKTITSFTVPKPNPDSKGAYKDIHANGHTKLFRTNGELWRDYTSKSSTPLASLLKVDLTGCTTLSSCTWEQIGAIADLGKGDDYWNIGDTKDMTLSTGEVLTMQIYDFNHDDKSDGSGRANITFGTKNLMAAKHSINPIDTNNGGWQESDMRAFINGITTIHQSQDYTNGQLSLYSQIPSGLRSWIKTVNKYTSGGLGDQTIKTSTDKLFIFSEKEIFGLSTYSLAGEGEKYPIFTDVVSRNKYYPNNSLGWWWLRSSLYNDSVRYIGLSGEGGGNGGASFSAGVAFGFTLGNAPKFNITFNSNGGSNVSTQNIEINKTITKPADPTKSGNIFLGWYKDVAYTTAWNFTTDKVTADTTLYAKWVATPPAIGIPLESFTWDQIAYISETGQADTYFDLGNEKTISLSNGETLTLQILGFNHDARSDRSGTANITFGTKHLMKDQRMFSNTSDSSGGWRLSSIRTYLNSTVYNYLSADLKAIITSVNKTSSIGGSNFTTTEVTSDKLFVFSGIEMGSSMGINDGAMYPARSVLGYTGFNKRLENGIGSQVDWWTRSPRANAVDGFYTFISATSSQLNIGNGVPYEGRGVAFGFCI